MIIKLDNDTILEIDSVITISSVSKSTGTYTIYYLNGTSAILYDNVIQHDSEKDFKNIKGIITGQFPRQQFVELWYKTRTEKIITFEEAMILCI